jgi:hypothetical protein
MGRRKATDAVEEQEWESDIIDLPSESREKTSLVLQKEPPPRKIALMASGVEHIRCGRCSQVKPIAGASEFGSSWICEECTSEQVSLRG